MRWKRLGRIFAPSGQRDWMVSHASVPYAEWLEGDLFRIYFTPRDAENRSHLGWLEIELTRPDRILRIAETPLLAPGGPGAFDDCGAMGSWFVAAAGSRHHYYIGWNLRRPMPFHVSIGRASAPAAVDVPGVLEKLPGPILVRGAPSASYNVRYAESSDGIRWRRAAAVAIDLVHPDEIAIARPAVLRDDGGYSMWYSWRGRCFPYRLGYATSPDGEVWTRHDD